MFDNSEIQTFLKHTEKQRYYCFLFFEFYILFYRKGMCKKVDEIMGKK